MNRGFVKLWRRIDESAVFQNEGLLKVFLWCMVRANYKDAYVMVRTGRGYSEVLLPAGSFLFGRESAARELRMPPSTVWKRIKKLKKLEILNIESNSHYSIINIINWHLYQDIQNESNSERNRQGTGKEHREEVKRTIRIKRGATPAPEIFPITDQMKAYAQKKGFSGDLQNLSEKFLNYHRAKGSKFIDWNAAFRNWILKEIEFHPAAATDQPLNGGRTLEDVLS